MALLSSEAVTFVGVDTGTARFLRSLPSRWHDSAWAMSFRDNITYFEVVSMGHAPVVG